MQKESAPGQKPSKYIYVANNKWRKEGAVDLKESKYGHMDGFAGREGEILAKIRSQK